MYEVWSEAPGIARIPSIDLRLAWHVVLEQSMVRYGYLVTKLRYPVGLIAVRTLSGSGSFHLSESESIVVKQGDVLLFDRKELYSYTCLTPKWDYWWFKFIPYGPFQIPLNRPIRADMSGQEIDSINRTFSLLKSHVLESRLLATSLFTELLFGWLADQPKPMARSASEEAVWSLIDQMHSRLNDNWSVRQMAIEAGLSERRLNQLFHQAVAMGPKRYFSLMRMKHAEHLLRAGNATVSKVAQTLGFKDSYHFSRSYKQCLGYPPSLATKQIAQISPTDQ